MLHHGATPMLDVRQAEQLVFTAGAAIPDLEQRIERQENFICSLLGNNPQSITRGRKLIDPHALKVPAGLPSSLLERRPDIRHKIPQIESRLDGSPLPYSHFFIGAETHKEALAAQAIS